MAVFPYSWRKRCKISINHNKVDGNIVDFPVLLTEDNLPSEMFSTGISGAQTGGGDIRFADENFDQLPCEVVKFTKSPASAEIYVKLDSISSSVDTDFYVYWYVTDETMEQPSPSASYGAYEVWEDFGAVFHMNQGTGQDIINSANQDYNLSPNNNPTSTNNGKIGKAQEFAYVSGDDDFFIGDTTTETASADIQCWEFWFKQSTDSNITHYPFRLTKNGNNTLEYYLIGYPFSPDTIKSRFRDKNGNLYEIGLFPVSNNIWYHLFSRVRETNFHAWSGESQYAYGAGPNYPVYSNTSGSHKLRIGSGHIGIIDEVRVHNVDRTDNWVIANHRNQDDPESFSSAGTPTSPTYTWDESISDGVKLGDEVLPSLLWDISASDGMTLGDSIDPELTANPDISDGMTFGDTISPGLTANPDISDGMILGDILDGGFYIMEEITDGFILGDETDRDIIYNPSVVDGFTIGDVIVVYASNDYPCDYPESQWVCIERQWQDDVRVVNEWSPPYYIYDETLEDGFTFADTLTPAMTAYSSTSDGFKFGDDLTGSGKQFDESLTDGFKFGDTTTVTIQMFQTIEDGIKFGDVLTVAVTGYESITDGIKFGDRLGKIYDESITDGIVFGEQLVGIKSILLNIIDGIKFSDEVSPQVNFVANVSDGFDFGDIVAQVYYLDAGDGIEFGDTISRVTQKFKVKAYLTALDKTFTFKVKRGDFTLTAEEEGFTLEAKKK